MTTPRMLTWKWYAKHELLIIALSLFLFGLLWLLVNEGAQQVDADIPAHIR